MSRHPPTHHRSSSSASVLAVVRMRTCADGHVWQDKAQFTPEGYVQENARIKAREVWARLSAEGLEGAEAAVPPDLVIGGDTARQPETLSC